MNMNNIRAYDPEVKPFGEVQYFCDDKGRDWYEFNTKFKKKYVVQYNKHGVVKAVVVASQAVFLHPGGTSIAELNTLPKGFSLSSAIWLFDGKKLMSSEIDPSIPTSYRKAQAMAEIGKAAVPLKDAIDMGEATEEEAEQYSNLRRLRIKLMRISDDTPPGDVDWAEFTTA